MPSVIYAITLRRLARPLHTPIPTTMLTVTPMRFEAPIPVDELRLNPVFTANYRNSLTIHIDRRQCVKAFANVVGMTLRPVAKASINLTFYAGMNRQGRAEVSAAAKVQYSDESGQVCLPPAVISSHSLRQLRSMQDRFYLYGRVMADRLADCTYRDIEVAKTATGHILSVTSTLNNQIFRLEFKLPG